MGKQEKQTYILNDACKSILEPGLRSTDLVFGPARIIFAF